ncbi:MAG: DUF2129 domain-containing protein [Bacillota bacterium]
MIKRKGIVIYFRNNRVIKKIKKFDINIAYINKLGKYLTGYVDESKYEEIKHNLKRLKHVKKIESSKIEMEELNFSA